MPFKDATDSVKEEDVAMHRCTVERAPEARLKEEVAAESMIVWLRVKKSRSKICK
jgi:hypothetical protein